MEKIYVLKNFPELSERIFIFLNTSTLLEFRLVCKTFNQIIENPYFWLKKIKFDGQPKNLLKMLQVISSISGELQLYGQQKFEESILKNVRLNQKDNQFYGIWNHRSYLLRGTEYKNNDKIIADSVLLLSEILTNFLSAWRHVIRNQSEVNYEFEKKPIFYLIKITRILKTFIELENGATERTISLVIKRRKRNNNWAERPFFKSKLEFLTNIFQSWCLFFALTLKYLPTLKCSHCLDTGNDCAAPKPQSKDHCSRCNDIYNLVDPPIGEENTWEFEELKHILELCFYHRKNVIDDCADYLIEKLLGKVAIGAGLFVDVKNYGFES